MAVPFFFLFVLHVSESVFFFFLPFFLKKMSGVAYRLGSCLFVWRSGQEPKKARADGSAKEANHQEKGETTATRKRHEEKPAGTRIP